MGQSFLLLCLHWSCFFLQSVHEVHLQCMLQKTEHPEQPKLSVLPRSGQTGAGPEPGDLTSAPSSCSSFDFQYVLPSPQMAVGETFPRLIVLARPLGSQGWSEQKLENIVIEYLIGLWWGGRWEDCHNNMSVLGWRSAFLHPNLSYLPLFLIFLELNVLF